MGLHLEQDRDLNEMTRWRWGGLEVLQSTATFNFYLRRGILGYCRPRPARSGKKRIMEISNPQ
jgi:hypothetical protein